MAGKRKWDHSPAEERLARVDNNINSWTKDDCIYWLQQHGQPASTGDPVETLRAQVISHMHHEEQSSSVSTPELEHSPQFTTPHNPSSPSVSIGGTSAEQQAAAAAAPVSHTSAGLLGRLDHEFGLLQYMADTFNVKAQQLTTQLNVTSGTASSLAQENKRLTSRVEQLEAQLEAQLRSTAQEVHSLTTRLEARVESLTQQIKDVQAERNILQVQKQEVQSLLEQGASILQTQPTNTPTNDAAFNHSQQGIQSPPPQLIPEVTQSNPSSAPTGAPGNPVLALGIPSPASRARLSAILASQAPTQTPASRSVTRAPSQQSLPGPNTTQPLRARFGVPRDRLPGNLRPSSSQHYPESSPSARSNEQGSA
ncbi:hypothetical protein BKA61DRAFT_580016 [Leptodontidium sp. MPI-SDFR-AT-0119]|nr:hypothetical protein BKA61DRAFT_580016 [Leptodontidium sp. MPI-SDFR-AT-0119]